MEPRYVDRMLRVDEGLPTERTVSQRDISALARPLIVLGDPGLGKTKLTESLEASLSGFRITGGSFIRTNKALRLHNNPQQLLIIDGLDEIAASSGSAAVDEVLKKLSAIGSPPFILSCRSADWQGSTDRYKIENDYGCRPTAVHLLPFSREDAATFLRSFDKEIDADGVLEELEGKNLETFYGNPLTLRLIAELVLEGKGLPQNRAELFDQSCRLLVREVNIAHKRSKSAMSDLDDLLDSAGAVFAHVLISASIGVSDRAREDTPNGYISKASLLNAGGAPLIAAAVHTRLFQSTGENLFVPIHRVIAEFLGARWVAKRLAAGISERRVFRCLTISGGVPTQLRGLHAWLAHFSPGFFGPCIRRDAYGVLRYGDVINAIHKEIGVPIEIKGQWHSSVWDASTVQLDANYSRDWRANGRGIYVVFWFGNVPGKNLPLHPGGLERPSTPEALQAMLVNELSESQRSRIDVVVLNLAKPT